MTYQGNNVKQWFVMRDLRRVNAKETAYKLLLKHGVEAFSPMSLQKNKKTGKKELVPVIHWLLFIHASKHEIDALIDPNDPLIPYLQYNYERGKSARYGGMVVDDKSMNYFRIALSMQNFPLVYHYDDITPDMRGRRVLVIRGEMIGYKGHIQKFSGGKNMKLFVELEKFYLAPIQIKPEDIVFIGDDDKVLKLGKKRESEEEEQLRYSRLSRVTDIINFLRFAVPHDFKVMTDEKLSEVRQVYSLANQVFEEYRIKDYLHVDEICKDKLNEIDKIMALRPVAVQNSDDAPLVVRMKEFCHLVRSADD